MNYKIIPYQLHFRFKAGTSRGVYTTHNIWYIVIEKNGIIGIGEVAPLKDLSIDSISKIEDKLEDVLRQITDQQLPTELSEISVMLDDLNLHEFPAIRFGIETAVLDFVNGGNREIFRNGFSKGEKHIPINGLIWMGDKDFMIEQIDDKLKHGFKCLKMKIGAISFDQECEILKYIRTKYSKDLIEIRVDANGAFNSDDAFNKLEILSQFHIHSIEQPIAPGQQEKMANLVSNTPIPIALDEELIGVNGTSRKELLEYINPHYIILKPTLIGGMQKSKEWIDLADQLEIGWWMTSALESNIGLNAIAQFCSEFDTLLPQGLGTGGLYNNNINSPLTVENANLIYNPKSSWDLSLFN